MLYRIFGTYRDYPVTVGDIIPLRRATSSRYDGRLRQESTFEEAKKLAFTYYEDSNYSLLVDGRTLYEQQSQDFGDDPWPNGFKANYKNLEQFIGYSHDQRLISAPYPVEKLFHPSTYDT